MMYFKDSVDCTAKVLKIVENTNTNCMAITVWSAQGFNWTFKHANAYNKTINCNTDDRPFHFWCFLIYDIVTCHHSIMRNAWLLLYVFGNGEIWLQIGRWLHNYRAWYLKVMSKHLMFSSPLDLLHHCLYKAKWLNKLLVLINTEMSTTHR